MATTTGSNYSCYSSHTWYPSTAPSYSLDDVAEEVASMPHEEQERARNDVNGSSESYIEETPELIDKSIAALNEELDLIDNKEAYDLAQLSCPEYVSSRRFKLMFLRSRLFNAKAAAGLIVQYWDDKVELFGVEKAFRGRITINDLIEEEDQAAMSCKGYLILPNDRHGRAIVFADRVKFLHGNNPLCCSDGMIRFVWFLFHYLVEDNDDVQKKGIVFISLGSPSMNSKDRRISSKTIKCLKRSIPWRVASLHHIIPTDLQTQQNGKSSNMFFHKELKHFMSLVTSYFLFCVGAIARARYRQHKVNLTSQDEKDELTLKLESYGISRDILPQRIGGNLDERQCQPWLDSLR